MIPRDSIDTSPEHVAALEAEVRELRNQLMIDRQVEAVLQATSRPHLRVVRA